MINGVTLRPFILRTGFLISALLFATHSVAYGEGFRLPYQGTAAAGQAEAFIAQADDASSLYYNPAGMTQVRGVQLYLGANFITGQFLYTSPSGETIEGDLRQPVVLPPPGHLYLTTNLEDLGYTSLGPLTLGIGVNSPFGLGTRWPEDGPFSSVVTDATLPLLDVKPTLAYKIGDILAVGAGADIYTFASFIGEGQAELKANIPGVAMTEVNGTDTAAGFNIAGLFTPLRNSAGKPLVNFGLVYRSEATLNLKGDFLVNGQKVADAVTTIPLPWVIGGGVAGWPIRNEAREWKIEVDAEGIGWSTFQNLDITLSDGTFISQPWNWNDTYTLSAGTEYKWLKLDWLPHWEITARGGYQRSQHANPDPTFNPAISDNNWNILAGGLGLRCKKGSHFLGLISCGSPDSGYLKAIVLDLAFQAAFWESRNIMGNIVSPTIDGNYRTIDWYIGSFSLGLVF